MKTLLLITTLTLTCSAYLCCHNQILAQTPTPSSREALVEAIKVRAQQDAKTEKPQANAQDLNLLFGKDAEHESISLREVMEIYDNAYSTAKSSKFWWDSFLPKVGWIAAIVLFFLLIAQETIKKTVSTRLEAVGEKVFRRVAGYRIFQRKALRKYRRALVDKYRFFQITFRPNRDLDMSQIYVPLKVKGTSDAEQVDDLGAISKYKRVTVIGAPGSGKSMLLKRITLLYATGRLKNYPGALVPVFIDLRRLNSVDKPLIDHLVDIFALNKFPEAKNFIISSLEQGKLLLLFDGLDEVNSIKRQAEVDKIKDLLEQYGDCSAIITCRTAVYKNEFVDIVDSTLEIVDFTDQQIQKFLGSWPGIPEGKSVDQLMLTLRERPRIMALARNPLLLTIIAFLYTDMEEFVLPYSRTEFYTQAVDVLLQQLKGQLNQYRVAPKLMVLEQLAIFNQERGSQNQSDRLSLDEQTVISQINKILPSLNLEAKDAAPLLREIVERSGLLLEIDGGTRYQFSHLTLQEYFAASALRGDGDKLSEFYLKDPDAWRETVKLWCGLPQDSTKLLQAINKVDTVTAFECLADAQKVDHIMVNTLIESFKPKLYQTNGDNEAIIRAFASVASGPSQRSQSVFSHLIDALDAAKDDAQREVVATALSLTNKPAAVQKLSEYAASSPPILAALVRMGDLAVAALSKPAMAGDKAALKALHAIGTPKAAKVLVSLLWHTDVEVATLSAFFLGSLFRQNIILDALSEYHLTTRERESEWRKWVWKPFDEPANSPLPVIAGRVAFLIETTGVAVEQAEVRELDKRIAIPIIVDHLERNGLKAPSVETLFTNEEMNRLIDEEEKSSVTLPRYGKSYRSALLRIKKGRDRFRVPDSKIEAEDDYFRVGNPPPGTDNFTMQLFLLLEPRIRFDLAIRLVDVHVTIKNWINTLRPSEYDFNKSAQFLAIFIMLGFFSALSLIEVFLKLRSSVSWFEFGNIVAVLSGLLLITIWLSILFAKKRNSASIARYFGGIYFAPEDITAANMLPDYARGDLVENTARTLWYFYKLCLTPIILYYTSQLMLRFLPFPVVVGAWISTFVAIFLLRWEGVKREREVFNPLKGILSGPQGSIDKPLPPHMIRTSVA
jgi:hypothetical protein